MEANGVLLQSIESIVTGLEVFGVAVVGITFMHATVRGLIHFGQKRPDAYANLKVYLGKALQLALEFLVAADIIQTVLIKPTQERIVSLGLLIAVRTFLSWSITVEIEGCWPWQRVRNKASAQDEARL